MSKMQRNKGARGERELAKLLEEQLGLSVTRNLMQTREGGHDLNGLPVALEVKRQETLKLNEWWSQAEEQGIRANKMPALAYRKSRHPWMFRVPISFFRGKIVSHTRNSYTADIDLETFCFLLRELWL